MESIDIIVPVKNEEDNVVELVRRIDAALTTIHTPYRVVFIDDHSTDKTVSRIRSLASKYPIKLLMKKGLPGKAFSVLEAARHVRSEFVVIIDGDLQYPPEVLPEMIAKTEDFDVVVARRQSRSEPLVRQISSSVFRLIFGQFLFGLKVDVQSGLKVFRSELLTHILSHDITAWTLDLPLLYTAHELGYQIGEVPIEFVERKSGHSKLKLVSSVLEIGGQAVRFKLKRSAPIPIHPTESEGMVGAGVIHRRKRFITHTTLPHSLSALHTITIPQRALLFMILTGVVGGFILAPLLALKVGVAILSVLYFSDVLFNLYLIFRSLHFPQEITFKKAELDALNDKDLPIYTILCPLYKEGHILPDFVKAIEKLDWPAEKLDVLLLLEEDDTVTVEAAKELALPAYIRTIVVPDSMPKTKPKACNYGLGHARGEYVVIYDAEDDPDPAQLKKAFIAFQKVPDNVRCLQAKLHYHNASQNLLTRFFTAEYALWFDVILTGLQSLNTSLPLGGTSNHFRTADLRELHGWDPFNVTEDCDLGMRLFKQGHQTAIIDSYTLEEANSQVGNWIRQRSRWIKGYMQTYLIHMRQPLSFWREHGHHAIFFQLIVGGKIAFMLINPFMWILTASYFLFRSVVGDAIESLFPSVVFYMAAFSLVVGNFLFIYYYMIGAAQRSQWFLIKYLYLVPLYWLLVSISAGIALYQLIVKPHYWEKTNHGLHKAQPVQQAEPFSSNPQDAPSPSGAGLGWWKPELFGGASFMATLMVANILNFGYNAYLGRVLPLAEFATVSLIGSFLYLGQMFFTSLSRTVNYQSAFLFGRYQTMITVFWKSVRRKMIWFALALTGTWLVLTPFLAEFFQVSHLSLLLFTPVWSIALYGAVDSGFLTGHLKFFALSLMVMIEGIVKFAAAFFLVEFGLQQWVYAAIPLSLLAAFSVGWLVASRVRGETKTKVQPELLRFPFTFFTTTFLTRVAVLAYISLDVLLAKRFLPPVEAGQYALLALVGKGVFFCGSLFGNFVVPLVGRLEGERLSSRKLFWLLVSATTLSAGVAVVAIGPYGSLTIPWLLGEEARAIVPLSTPYALAIAAFTTASTIVTYHQARKHYLFSIVSFSLAVVQVIGMSLYHQNIGQVVEVMVFIGAANLATAVGLHMFYPLMSAIWRNLFYVRGLFGAWEYPVAPAGKLRFLVLNWRDTKHAWAGGAETYIHEIAKVWVKAGHAVTVLCGSDGRQPRSSVVDGVQVHRYGGFYSVYFWAAVYYFRRFRGQVDVVIDCENGIPFFTPLYVQESRFLLIYHIHQEVFRHHLTFPLSLLAMFIEAKAMPWVYENERVITISESSKKDILSLGLGNHHNGVVVIEPGSSLQNIDAARKTPHPLFSYIGRLKPYKNVDVAIRAFAAVVKKFPHAELVIAGRGESRASLDKLVRELGLQKSVRFMGRVNEELKTQLLSQSWAALQPSSFEGWGITVIEANACGTPVIASNVHGLRDSVVPNKTGILVKQRDVQAFAKAMIQLLENQTQLAELSQAAHLWSHQFRWESAAQRFVDTVQDFSPAPLAVRAEEVGT